MSCEGGEVWNEGLPRQRGLGGYCVCTVRMWTLYTLAITSLKNDCSSSNGKVIRNWYISFVLIDYWMSLFVIVLLISIPYWYIQPAQYWQFVKECWYKKIQEETFAECCHQMLKSAPASLTRWCSYSLGVHSLSICWRRFPAINWHNVVVGGERRLLLNPFVFQDVVVRYSRLLSVDIWLDGVFNRSRVLSLLSLLKGTPNSCYEGSDRSLSLATTTAMIPLSPALSAIFLARWDYKNKLLLTRLLIAKLSTKLRLLSSLIAAHVCLWNVGWDLFV